MISLILDRVNIYVRYYWKACSIYCIHPAFLFDFIEFVFDKKRLYYGFIQIDQAIQIIQTENDIIPSDPFAQDHHQEGLSIARMFKKSGHSHYEYESLYRMALFLKPKNTLELGASVGLSGLSISLANPKAKHISVEGNQTFAQFSNILFQKFGLMHSQCVHSAFDTFLNNWTQHPIDFIFIDGDHRYDTTLKNFNKILKNTTEDAVFLLDDIHWSKDMYQAWNELSHHPSIQCSLECMRWGLLFKSKKISPGQYVYIDSKFKPWQRYLP